MLLLLIAFCLFSLSQHKLEGALLALGQFQHALSELQSWLSHTHTTLDTQRPICSDPKAIEIELAKHHVWNIWGIFMYSTFYFLFNADSFNQAVFVGFKKRCAVPSGYSGDGEQRRLWAAGVQSWRRNQPPERPAGRAQPQLEEPSAEDWWEAEAFGSCPATGAL